MTDVPSPLRRPPSYSESDIRLPRVPSSLRPLMETGSPTLTVRIPTPPQVLSLQIPSPQNQHAQMSTKTATAHRWAIRFSLHLALIGLFETVFFWKFVAPSEDTALINLINGYATTLLQACATLTPQEQSAFRGFVGLFLNQTTVDTFGIAAAARRATHNDTLLRNSWLYFGGLTTLCASLSAATRFTGQKIRWSHIAAENLILVTMLGLYEWMFFRTVVLQYESVSMPELDRMVLDEFNAQC
jgi:hypothetical protein